MAFRVARGLFRLWIVVSALWISGVAATTNWGRFLHYQPVIEGEQPPGRLRSTVDFCRSAKKAEECSAMLKAAGKNPYAAFDLKWTDTGWDFPDNTVMVPAEGIAWMRVWPVAGLAFIPPMAVLVIGTAFVWAIRGFRQP
jgi:hypothetical protein